MLEDDAVPAADAEVLRDVDDPHAAVGGARLAPVEPVAPALPEARLGVDLALALLHAARLGLEVGERARGREHDAAAGLPGAQAVVHVLVGHAVGLVEQADVGAACRAVMYMHAPVTLSDGLHDVGGGREVGVTEAEAVVEPLRRARVAHGRRRTGSSSSG